MSRVTDQILRNDNLSVGRRRMEGPPSADQSLTCAQESRGVKVFGLYLLIGVPLITWIFFDPEDLALLALPSDDAFYYFAIARNIVEGNGMTFDGISATNGWHPLWMLCLLPIFQTFTDDLESPVRVVLILNAVMAIATIAWLHQIVNRYVAPGLGLIAIALAILPHVSTAMTNGLETGLLLLATVSLIHFWFRFEAHALSAASATAFAFGLFIGLVTLCRLDAAFLLPASIIVLLADAFRQRASAIRTVTHAILQSLGFFAIFGIYVAWNVRHFGQIMPISGVVKSSLPALRNSLSMNGDLWIGLVLLGLVWITMLLSQFSIPPDRPRSPNQAPILLLALSCTFHFLHAFLFLDWGVYWWHFAQYGLCLTITIPALLHRWLHDRPSRRTPIALAAIPVCLVIAAPLIQRQISIKYRQHASWRDAAEWAQQHTPIDSVFALKDAGLFGYFSERCVINLDGKANGRAYLNHLKQGTVKEYLRIFDTHYIADVHARYHEGLYAIAIPRVNQDAIVLIMRETDEVFRSSQFPAHASRYGASPNAHFAIWTYPSTAPTITP